MQFSKKYNPDADVVTEDGTNRSFIKYFKKDHTTFRILQEPEDWVDYWEHFNPGGYPFPCTRDRDTCPGCTSTNEKMKKAQKRIAFNVIEGDYVNVYKFPKTLAEKIRNRADRIGTIRDRDYTITKITSKLPNGDNRVDYDVESEDKIAVDFSAYEPKDVEQMLAEAYDQTWNQNGVETTIRVEDDQRQSNIKKKVQAKEPPFEKEKVWSEAELRAIPTLDELASVVESEGADLPEGWEQMNVDSLVDWLIEQ